ncbi:hypothetical protein BDZ45DRAFT_702784 [Acephala macrosclerotiorum]|nr:hypothetical protein BDZ45DRAFT_702784 [Acephala macrosclerotiorum]
MSIRLRPVNEPIFKINDSSWVVGGRILLSLQCSPSSTSSWTTTHIEKLHDVRGVSAAWRIGDAFCKTLGEAWPAMDEATKQHYVSQVAHICKELAVWHGDCVSGVDGRRLSDLYLIRNRLPKDCCRMDSSIFIFYYCDWGPGNIMKNSAEHSADERVAWRRRVQRQLGEDGFSDVAER